jgi:hypothetical protein
VIKNGLTWSRQYPNVISNGTYASNPNGYQTVKTEIQKTCQEAKFKRALLLAIRKMNDDEQDGSQDESDGSNDESDGSSDSSDSDDDKKRK